MMQIEFENSVSSKSSGCASSKPSGPVGELQDPFAADEYFWSSALKGIPQLSHTSITCKCVWQLERCDPEDVSLGLDLGIHWSWTTEGMTPVAVGTPVNSSSK